MTKKGKSAESMARQELNKIYEKSDIIKAAQWQRCPDYLVLSVKRGVEVKNRVGKKFYPKPHDKEQWEDHFKEFIDATGFTVEYWIYTRENKKVIKEELTFKEFGMKYLKKHKCPCCEKVMAKSTGKCIECNKCMPGMCRKG